MVNASNMETRVMIQSYINRLESLIREKKDILEAIKDLKVEAKANGLNPKPLTQFISDVEKGWDKVEEEEWERDMVRKAMGHGLDSEEGTQEPLV